MKRLVFAFVVVLLGWSPAVAGTYEEADIAYDAKDYELAKSILLPLSEEGDARAMNMLGLMYEYGDGYPKNAKLACDWYEKSAALGYTAAKENYSSCFARGFGREQDTKQALSLCHEAMAKGRYRCAVWQLINYAEKDRELAAYWGQKAIDAGSKTAAVLMRLEKLPYEGPSPSFKDYFCVTIEGPLFDRPYDYCEG